MSEAGDGARDARRDCGPVDDWREVFIATLAATSHIEEAARQARVTVDQAHRMRRKDPTFASSWFAALCEGYDCLEMELLYRLRSGRIEEADADGTKRKFDIATGFKVLTAHREQLARTGHGTQEQDERAIIDSINRKIDAMRAREQEVSALLAEEGVILPRVPDGPR